MVGNEHPASLGRGEAGGGSAVGASPKMANKSLNATAQAAFNCDRCLIGAGVAGQVVVKSNIPWLWRGVT